MKIFCKHHRCKHSRFSNILIFFCVFFVLLSFPAFAQNFEPSAEEAAGRQELFFAALMAEVAGYSYESAAYGGGLSIGTGSGTAIGVNLVCFMDPQSFVFIELLVFLRFYFFGSGASTGPFVQFIGGPVIYADSSFDTSGFGNFSAGLGAGWRIPLGERFYIEPAVRAGFPYIFGGGVSSGFRY